MEDAAAINQVPAYPPSKIHYHAQDSRYSIPRQNIVSIEHPYIIRNLDRGIESLGGIPKLRLVSQSTWSEWTSRLISVALA